MDQSERYLTPIHSYCRADPWSPANGSTKYQETPFDTVKNKMVMEELERCCQNLPPPYNDTAVKFFMEGKTAKEISQQTGIGIHTVQTHIYRAREKLKATYRKEMLEE